MLHTMTAETAADRSAAHAWARFRAYWAALTVSTVGDSFTLVALPIAAYQVQRSSVLVGFVDMMEILSGVLLGTALGVVADRSDPRTVMWCSDAVRALLLAGLAVMAATDTWSPAVLLVVAFGLGALRAFHDGAESALLAAIIPAGRDMAAFARISSAESVSRLIGPFVGGLTLELGLWAAFGVDALTFVAAAAVVLTMPRRPLPPARAADAGRSTMRADLREAAAAMRAQPTYLALVGIGAFGNLAGLTTAGLFVPYASEVLHLQRLGLGFGLLLSLIGVGGVVANIVTNRQSHTDPRGAGLAMVSVGVAVLVAGLAPSWPTAIAAMAVTGFGIGYYQANYSAYRQKVFAPELLGRVSMATRTVFYLTMTVGFLAGGVIAEVWGPDRMLTLYGAVAVVGCLVIGFVPIDLDPQVSGRARRR